MSELRLLTRRRVLGGLIGVSAVSGLAACRIGRNPGVPTLESGPARPTGPHPTTGTVRNLTLTARPVQVDLAGQVVSTWGYGDTVPGQPLRAMIHCHNAYHAEVGMMTRLEYVT